MAGGLIEPRKGTVFLFYTVIKVVPRQKVSSLQLLFYGFGDVFVCISEKLFRKG